MAGRRVVHENRADVRVEQAQRPFDQRIAGHVVGAVTLALILALLWLCWMLAHPTALLLAAIILASAIEPVVHSLMRWMRRSFAIAVIAVTLLGTIALAAAVVAPRVDDQIAEAVRNLPALIERARGVVESWLPISGGIGSQLVQPSESSNGGSSLATYPLAVASSMFEAMLVVFMSLYWLVAMPAVREFLLSLLPPDRTSEARSLLSEIGDTMGGYVRGVLIEALLIGVLVFAGLYAIGVLGALIVVPLAGALRIVVLRLVAPAIRRRTGGLHFAVADTDKTTLVVG